MTLRREENTDYSMHSTREVNTKIIHNLDHCLITILEWVIKVVQADTQICFACKSNNVGIYDGWVPPTSLCFYYCILDDIVPFI